MLTTITGQTKIYRLHRAHIRCIYKDYIEHCSDIDIQTEITGQIMIYRLHRAHIGLIYKDYIEHCSDLNIQTS